MNILPGIVIVIAAIGAILFLILFLAAFLTPPWDHLAPPPSAAGARSITAMAIIWRNELHPHELPYPFAADPPPGIIEIARVEEVGGNYHIWYAPVPAVPAAPSDAESTFSSPR